MNSIVKIIPIFFFVIVVIACKRELPAMSQLNEECSCAHEVTADFNILEILNMYEQNVVSVETDNILAPSNVVFEALEENASYEWFIGQDVEHTKNVSRWFYGSLVGQTIPITLVVHKEPNKICFPKDDGIDTLTKEVKLFSYSDSSMLEGTFRVAEEGSTDSLDIVFDFVGTWSNNIYYPSTGGGLAVNNFDGQGKSFDYTSRHVVYRGYRGFKSDLDFYDFDQVNTLNYYVHEARMDSLGNYYLKHSYKKEFQSNIRIVKEMWGRKL